MSKLTELRDSLQVEGLQILQEFDKPSSLPKEVIQLLSEAKRRVSRMLTHYNLGFDSIIKDNETLREKNSRLSQEKATLQKSNIDLSLENANLKKELDVHKKKG